MLVHLFFDISNGILHFSDICGPTNAISYFLILVVVTFYERKGRETSLPKWSFIGLFLLTPLLLFVQDFREGIDAIGNIDFVRYYVDIWRVFWNFC